MELVHPESRIQHIHQTMKQVLLFFLLYPVFCLAQNKSRFVNDTLYTSCGYKIYPGQILRFGKTNSLGIYNFIDINSGIPVSSLENNSVEVKKLSKYGYAKFGYPAITVKGSIVYRDSSKGLISIELGFDQAIGSRLPGTRSELVLPDEFYITREKAAELYLPAFENDTLYTSCGYKIYKGQVLHFGKLTGRRGKFRYVNVKNGVPPRWLEDNQVTVTKIKEFGVSVFGNAYIYVTGTIIYDKRKIDIEVHMAFDNAIGRSTTVPGELLVPEEFGVKIKPGPEPDKETEEN